MPSENTKIIQYTLENSNKSGEKIIYSLTEEIPPFIKKKLSIHFINNEPLTVFNYAIKTYQEILNLKYPHLFYIHPYDIMVILLRILL